MVGLIRDTCPVFKTGSTNQTKIIYFLCVLCVLSNDSERGRGKATYGSGREKKHRPSSLNSIAWIISKVDGIG
jgi:hypothetical protein